MTVTVKTAPRDVKTPFVVVSAIVAGTVILAIRSPHEGGYGMCPILAFTGFLCPTCGGLRTVHDLAHFDILGAWAMNPLLTVVLPIAGLMLLAWWWRAWRGLPRLSPPDWFVISGAIVIVGFGVLRNL